MIYYSKEIIKSLDLYSFSVTDVETRDDGKLVYFKEEKNENFS